MNSNAVVAVAAAGVWTSPDAARALDAPALANPVDIPGWCAAQGTEERRDLWGRHETQVLLNEPVIIDSVEGDWAKVVAVRQPSRKDSRGYPGWIPLCQLGSPAEVAEASVVVKTPTTEILDSPGGSVLISDVSFATILPAVAFRDDWVQVNLPDGKQGWMAAATVERVAVEPVLPTADQLISDGRQFLGLMYLAGGTHGLSLDCSGLVHLLYRRYGHTVPRDATDKMAVGDHVTLADLQPGDMMFFAKPGTGFVYHCGICTGDGTMLHVSQTDWECLDAPLTEIRQNHLLTGRRLLG